MNVNYTFAIRMIKGEIGLIGNKFRQHKAHDPDLGGLMNNLKLYPFMVRKVINDDTDLNAVTENGIYQLIGASGNNTPIRWGILLVFGYGGYLFQILSNVSTDIVVVKLRIGNEIGFSDWKTVSLT